jgi:hypothetical protein
MDTKIERKSDGIDFDKLAKVLNNGGKLYLHSIDYDKIRDIALKNSNFLVFEKIVRNDYIQPGTAVAFSHSAAENNQFNVI